ncbi:PREDICTED: nucleolin-like [Populus euphratica]|uniref:Nucleolin-like n=1 Tax=Populus euphratica TaxID=75702 RepID=A0AAJ6TST8_POPEU|nr:PREDICTED: nucleolin-like [Populus euphratica]
MARKHLIEEPPPAVSSSEEEETDDKEEEPQNGTAKTQQNAAGEKSNDDEDRTEDDEEEDDDEEVEKKKPDLPSKPSKPSSESDSDADSEDTESTHPPSPSLSGFTIKPISPKLKPDPKPDQPKKEKDVDDKKAKKGAGPETGGSQRIWSDEDEIVILKGMIEFQNEKGKNSTADTGDFYGFVKESLCFNASNNQFVNKIRMLKKKYFTDVEKNESGKYETFKKPHDLECVELAKKIWGAGAIVVGNESNASKNSGKNVSGGGGGIILALAKLGSGEVNGKGKEASVKRGKRGSSEEVSGEGKQGNLKKKKRVLSEEGDGGEEGNVKKGKRGLSEEVIGERKGKGGKKEKQAANNELSGGEDANVKKQKRVVNGEWKESSMKKQKAVENEEVEGGENLWDKYPYLRSSLLAEDLPEDVKERAMMMLGKVPEENLVELEREWRSLMNAKLEFFMMENDLIAKQMKLALDALKSQDY